MYFPSRFVTKCTFYKDMKSQFPPISMFSMIVINKYIKVTRSPIPSARICLICIYRPRTSASLNQNFRLRINFQRLDDIESSLFFAYFLLLAVVVAALASIQV